MAKNNFEIKDGRIIFNGKVLNPDGIWKPREDGEKRVVKPKPPRMRHEGGSLLTGDQRVDEDYQTELKIA